MINIDAHEVATGTTNIDHWTTSWGSYERTVYGDKSLEVILRNVSRLKGFVNVTVSFMCNGAETGHASKDFDLAGQIEVKSRIAAPTTKMEALHLAALGYDSAHGVPPPTTWIIVARNGSGTGPIIATKAANGSMQEELDRKIKSGALK
jgi:hypothetical protein